MKNYLLTIGIIVSLSLFVSCDKGGLNADIDDLGNNKEIVTCLIGNWTEVYNRTITNIHFLSNGEGYRRVLSSDEGIWHRYFTWKVVDNMLNINYPADEYNYEDSVVYEVSIISEGNIELVTTHTGAVSKYDRLSKDGTTNIDYKSTPFESFIKIYGTYYAISKVVQRCNHGTGTNANMKHLQFFGPNGQLEPVGARFMYSTPYYEGIDSEWHDGTYKIDSDSGYWIYGGMYYYRSSGSSRCNGTLKIKTVGKIKYYDFNLDGRDVIGHCVAR